MNPPAPPPSRPRVLHCLTHLALGGAEQVAFTLLHGLRTQGEFAVFTALDRPGDEIGARRRRDLAAAGVPLHPGTRFPFKLGGMLLAGHRLALAVRRFRPDLLHLHTEIPEAAAAAMVALHPATARMPVVRTIHNSVYWAHWRPLGRWCDRRLPRPFVVGVSAAALTAFARLRAESRAGPLPASPVLIPNGVIAPPARRPPDRTSANLIRILFAGRFEPQKGADLLPDVLRLVRPPAGRDCELILHGHGSLEPLLRALAAHPPPGWHVQVLGPRADLSAGLTDFDLVLMPSRFEGLSLLAVEAQQAGVPVIATDAPGLQETLPAHHPWVARAGDAASFARCLQAALAAPASWSAVAEQARGQALTRFDAGRMCAAYLDLYAAAFGHRAPISPE